MDELENKNNDIPVPIMADISSRGETVDVLFWVGCAGAYDDRYQKVTRDFVKILHNLKRTRRFFLKMKKKLEISCEKIPNNFEILDF